MRPRAIADGPARRTVELGGGAISCLEWKGPGFQNLLFAHANGFNAQTYRTLLAPLSDCLDLFACDLRGHGSSTLPTSSGLAAGWTVFRDDLIALVARLSEAPPILAGHSLGATAALMAAALAPAHVRALVLVKPDTRVITVEGAGHFLPIEWPEPVREEIRRVTRQAPPAAAGKSAHRAP